jgi:hypothetical protein
MFASIVKSPYLNLIAGLVLLFTAGYEVYEAFEAGGVGMRHGVFVFALVNILQSLPEVLHGLDDLDKVKST